MYIYKLGHCPEFGVLEFEFLTKQTVLWHNQNWLISGEFCDTSVCGSLVFGGQIENENLENDWQNGLENDDKNEKNYQIDKPKKIQNINNSIQNWNEENKTLGQKLEIDLENELENLDELDNKNVFEILGEFLQKNPYKKIGIAILTSFDQQKVMNLAKKCGSKKINIISCLPNYGHWKSCKKWIVIIQNPIRKISQKSQENSIDNSIEVKNLQNLQFQKLVLFEITGFCNQEYWANMDQNLPSGEMSRGLMNLKLARTLVNLTDKKVILDPFCGSGRTMAAGFGLDKKFILTDIEKVCEQEVWNNLEFLENERNGKLWKKTQDLELENNLENENTNLEKNLEENLVEHKLANNLHQNLDKIKTNSKIQNEIETQTELKNDQQIQQKNLAKNRKLITNLTLDATQLSKLKTQKEMENINFSDIAIITEGFLGTNFKKMPTLNQIQTEFENLEKTWAKTLSESVKIGIEEIVFCLPFYNLKAEKSENFGENKHKTETTKVNHKKKFAEDTANLDNKIDKKTNFQKIESGGKDREVKNTSKEKTERKPKLITSNLAIKSSNYQSKSQIWTPKSSSKSFDKNPSGGGSYSKFGDKTFDNKKQNRNEKREEFGNKYSDKYQPKKEFEAKFDKNISFTGESGEKKYEKKNYGKSQNKRGSSNYKFGKSDYKFDEKSEDKMNNKSRRSFGNINKSGKPTSYKIKPKFEKENTERKESRESRENRINSETKNSNFTKFDNYKTKSPNLKFPNSSLNNSRTNSKFGIKSKQNRNSRENSENNKPVSNYSNFSKSQTWENSQKNYQNRWENIDNNEKKLNENNYSQNKTISKPQSTRYSKNDFGRNPIENEFKNSQNFKKPSKFTKKTDSFSSSKNSFSDKFDKNINKTSIKTSTFLENNSKENKKTQQTLSKPNSENKVKNQIILPPFLDKLIANSDYEFVWENKHLLYSRDDSFVGHLVIKLKLKK